MEINIRAERRSVKAGPWLPSAVVFPSLSVSPAGSALTACQRASPLHDGDVTTDAQRSRTFFMVSADSGAAFATVMKTV